MKVGCLTICGDDGEKRFLLKNLSVFEAGRSQGNHIYLKDPSVAMSHFRVYRTGQSYSIYDLGSSKGTVVNGERVDKVDLNPGDRILAGDLEMEFSLVGDDSEGRLASSAPDSNEADAQATRGGIITKTARSTPALIVIDGNDRGKRHSLSGKKSYKIGRSSHCDLKLADGKVSRDHAMITEVDDGHVIVDLESANGTVVNGDRIDRKPLKEGDFIRLGYTILKYDRV